MQTTLQIIILKVKNKQHNTNPNLNQTKQQKQANKTQLKIILKHENQQNPKINPNTITTRIKSNVL